MVGIVWYVQKRKEVPLFEGSVSKRNKLGFHPVGAGTQGSARNIVGALRHTHFSEKSATPKGEKKPLPTKGGSSDGSGRLKIAAMGGSLGHGLTEFSQHLRKSVGGTKHQVPQQ